MIDENAVKLIQQSGVPCVNFFCDNVRMFSKIPSVYKVFNLNWVPEFKALELYRNARFPFLHLPMPMWVAPENRVIASDKISAISFIGSHDVQRQLLFEQIVAINPDIPLNIYGYGWNNKSIKQVGAKKDYTKVNQLHFQIEFIKKEGIFALKRKWEQRNFRQEISSLLKSKLRGKPTFDEYVRITKNSNIIIGVNRYTKFSAFFNQSWFLFKITRPGGPNVRSLLFNRVD